MAKFQLYTATVCASCDKVRSYLLDRDFNIEEINIDVSDRRPSFPIIIVPALIMDDRLLAYGDDIITELEKQSNAQSA